MEQWWENSEYNDTMSSDNNNNNTMDCEILQVKEEKKMQVCHLTFENFSSVFLDRFCQHLREVTTPLFLYRGKTHMNRDLLPNPLIVTLEFISVEICFFCASPSQTPEDPRKPIGSV